MQCRPKPDVGQHAAGQIPCYRMCRSNPTYIGGGSIPFLLFSPLCPLLTSSSHCPLPFPFLNPSSPPPSYSKDEKIGMRSPQPRAHTHPIHHPYSYRHKPTPRLSSATIVKLNTITSADRVMSMISFNRTLRDVMNERCLMMIGMDDGRPRHCT